ncbi:BolA family protein [Sodalinema gerasimenkoae]|uniref:BolA family protein n=1 Tax=Sodalinema gerasimenkoae TaxID=2862348 RepID=UPI00135A1DFF|nr:BolA family transcriptional regulator [Sodalinema gerasimenkoae]MCC5898113.1 BolA family transcriptional regulator [Phormidium sp. BM_Day4_Bin.17]UCJ11723.1 MAG: BolA family transcriptional regulator [Phormidium sp. PBR-2020]
MVSLDRVADIIRTELGDAEVQVRDLTGGGDHLEALIISPRFEGLSLVQQHQLVYGALRSELASEAIHALALKTYTPDKWAATSQVG